MRMNLSARLLNTTQAKQVIATAIACCVLVCLPSCGIFPLRCAEVGAPIPTAYKGGAGTDSFAQLGPAEFFNDPLLTGLLEQALDPVRGNRELLGLNEEIQVAGAEILARQG